MNLDLQTLRDTLRPLAQFVDDHTANASDDTDTVSVPVGLLRSVRDLHDSLDRA